MQKTSDKHTRKRKWKCGCAIVCEIVCLLHGAVKKSCNGK